MGIGAGIAAAAAVGAAASAGGSAASGHAKGKAAKKLQKEADRSYARDQARIFAAREGGQADAQRTAGNIMAQEQARSILASQMGRPGTWDDLTPAGVGGIGGAAPSLGVWNEEQGQFGTKDVKNPKGGANRWTFDPQQWESQGYQLDPNAIAGQAMDSQSFKNISYMTAEIGQALQGKGELFNNLSQSIVGGTFGATAARSRVIADELARGAARGGDAASAAMKFAEKMNAQEEVNRTHVNALWNSKLQMEQWIHGMAGQVQNLGQAWIDNAAGVRDQFGSLLNNAQNFWTNVMIPILLPQSQDAANKQAAATAQAQQMALDAKLQKISAIATGVSSIAKIAGGAMSGMSLGGAEGSMGALGGGYSSLDTMHAALGTGSEASVSGLPWQGAGGQ